MINEIHSKVCKLWHTQWQTHEYYKDPTSFRILEANWKNGEGGRPEIKVDRFPNSLDALHR
jgi:hypothetical protein